MKVLIFTYLFPNQYDKYNGTFNVSRAKALKDIGHDVFVISPISYGFPLRYLFPRFQYSIILADIKKKRRVPLHETIDGIDVIHPKYFGLPRKLIWQYSDYELRLFAGRKIKKAVMKFRPDVILAPWIHPYGSYLRFIRKYFKFKAYAIADGSDLLIYPKIFPGWKRVEKKLNKSCDAIFCVSKNMTDYAREETKLNNVKQLNLGFSSNSFIYDKRHIKDNSVFKLISIGNLRLVKGHDILLNAMLHLNDNVHLSIIGGGPERHHLENFIESNNLSARVKLLGKLPLSQMVTHLQQSHLFCMPSRSEGFGIAPLEAMSLGLPVVASNVGAMPEYVIDDFNGYIFQAQDVPDMVRKLKKAINKTWQPSEIAAYVNTEYTWNIWAKKIELEFADDLNQAKIL